MIHLHVAQEQCPMRSLCDVTTYIVEDRSLFNLHSSPIDWNSQWLLVCLIHDATFFQFCESLTA